MLEDWLAGVVDFNGHIGVRLGSRQLQPYVSIYSRNRDNLEMLREVWPDFSNPIFMSRNLFMSQIVSISGTKRLLDRVGDGLMILGDPARLALEFCNLRLGHLNQPYNLRELQIVEELIRITSRKSTLDRRLQTLEKWA